MRGHRAGAVLAAMGLATSALAGTAAPSAQADGVITTEPYVKLLRLDQIHAQGYTGAGIKIALIDSRVDTTVPELKGAHITVKPGCNPQGSFADVPHATAVASILVSKAYGVAPDATLTDYVIPEGDLDKATRACDNPLMSSQATMLNQAITDGADIVVITSVSPPVTPFANAMARAALMGVPVIVGVGNNARRIDIDDMASANGTVGVSSCDMTGSLSKFSNYGLGVTICAPGEDLTMRTSSASGGPLTTITPNQQGTSFATPIVAGMMALAKQGHPSVNGNQLISSLMKTGYSTNHKWVQGLGWGTIDGPVMISDAIEQYPTTNPLMDKFPGGEPTAKQFASYRDGLTDPVPSLLNDPGYVYRGTDQIIVSQWKNSQPGTKPTNWPAYPSTGASTSAASASASASSASAAPSASATPGGGHRSSHVGWVLGGVALAAALVLGALVALRGRRSRP